MIKRASRAGCERDTCQRLTTVDTSRSNPSHVSVRFSLARFPDDGAVVTDGRADDRWRHSQPKKQHRASGRVRRGDKQLYATTDTPTRREFFRPCCPSPVPLDRSPRASPTSPTRQGKKPKISISPAPDGRRRRAKSRCRADVPAGCARVDSLSLLSYPPEERVGGQWWWGAGQSRGRTGGFTSVRDTLSRAARRPPACFLGPVGRCGE